MAEFDPNFDKSSVKGIPSLFAISFTFSWLAFCSSLFVEAAAAGTVGFAALVALTAGAGVEAADGVDAPFALAITLAITYYWDNPYGLEVATYTSLVSCPNDYMISALEAPEPIYALI